MPYASSHYSAELNRLDAAAKALRDDDAVGDVSVEISTERRPCGDWEVHAAWIDAVAATSASIPEFEAAVVAVIDEFSVDVERDASTLVTIFP